MLPSLTQLSDAVQAFIEDNPDDLISVVVDATFGHRIDTTEVAEFEAAIEHNELVAPPAGAVGRGDAFVLAIANKVGATILSNDSFQEFHGVYDWLFDDGRLIGGKPVPHVGWVFVPRLPVRGPLSRKSVREAGGKSPRAARGAASRPSKVASGPLPVPKSPPPGAKPASSPTAPHEIVEATVRAAARTSSPGRAPTPAAEPTIAATALQHAAGGTERPAASKAKADPTNDLMVFLGFVENHPIGSNVDVVVDTYSSHGAYVKIGDVVAYLPLRLMSSPPPRSARDIVKIGEVITLAVSAYHAQRRSIELCIPALAPAGPELVVLPETKAAKPRKRVAAKLPVDTGANQAVAVESPVLDVVEAATSPTPAGEALPAKAKRPSRRSPGKGAAGTTTGAPAPESSALEATLDPAPPVGAPLVVVKPAQRGRGGRGRRAEVLEPIGVVAEPIAEVAPAGPSAAPSASTDITSMAPSEAAKPRAVRSAARRSPRLPQVETAQNPSSGAKRHALPQSESPQGTPKRRPAKVGSAPAAVGASSPQNEISAAPVPSTRPARKRPAARPAPVSPPTAAVPAPPAIVPVPASPATVPKQVNKRPAKKAPVAPIAVKAVPAAPAKRSRKKAAS